MTRAECAALNMETEPQSPTGPAALIGARGLKKSYARRSIARRNTPVHALLGVDLDVRVGSTLALVGESGSGKSTLARCLALLERPDSGEVWFDGRNVTALKGRPLFRLRREIQLILQDPVHALNPRFSVEEIVEEPLIIQRVAGRKERRERVGHLLEQAGLPASLRARFPGELSGGQRQRLAIARALALEPRLLILDEALAGLDLSVQAQIVNLLLDLQADHSLTYVYISHDLSLVAHLADEVAVMNNGEIVERAATSDLFGNARHANTRALLEAIPSLATALKRCHI